MQLEGRRFDSRWCHWNFSLRNFHWQSFQLHYGLQPLTEMNTRNISWGKGGLCLGLTTLPLYVPIVLKSGNLNLLEPSGPVHVCSGFAVHFVMSVTICRHKLVPCFDTTRIFINHQYAQTQTVLLLNVILSNTCAFEAFLSIKEQPAQHRSVLSVNLNLLNPQDLSTSVQGLLYLLLCQ